MGPYKTKNVYHDGAIKNIKKVKGVKPTNLDWVCDIQAKSMPLVGAAELYVKSSAERGNLRGFVSYNPSYKPHVGKKKYFI